MKGWIELSVLTHTEKSLELEELNLPLVEDFCTYNKEYFQISRIDSIDMTCTSGGLIHINSEPIYVKEPPEEILKLIQRDSLFFYLN